MDTLDTAIAYGTSEAVLGEIGVGGWRVISKLPPVPAKVEVGRWVEAAVKGSLARLGIRRLGALLLHRPSDLLSAQGDAIYGALVGLKAEGLVAQVGVSVYHPEEIEALFGRFPLDVVQAPFSVIDRRVMTSGWMTRLHDAGVALHVRSVFLQGLLLLDPRRRAGRFRRWERLLREWQEWVDESQVPAVAACIGFALSKPEVERVVVGVDRADQLREIISGLDVSAPPPPDHLMSEDLDLVDPSRWTDR